MADGDVHQEVPAVFSEVRNEQVGPLPVVVVNGPEDSEPTVIHTQTRRVGQRLQVRLDGIYRACR